MNQDFRKKLTFLINKSHWTKEEQNWIIDFLDSKESDYLRVVLYESFQKDLSSPLTESERLFAENLLNKVHDRLGISANTEVHTIPLFRRISKYLMPIAAIFILIIGAIYIYTKPSLKNKITHSVVKNDIAPGKDKAVLTLADGSIIVLDDTQKDTLAKQGELNIIKNEKGALAYINQVNNLKNNNLYNTITTPNGGQFKILLSDGTGVWLNASSSIRFPVIFEKNARKISITGEVYIEVSKSNAPFIVEVDNKAEVFVTGTKFNINAYRDEASIKTTLAEGVVQVKKLGDVQYQKLKVGQQAEIKEVVRINQEIDMESVLAWKNGKFDFGAEMAIQDVMRQVARWYDVEVVFEDKIERMIGGSIARNVPVSKVLEMIELTGTADCRIEGKRVYIRAGNKK